MILKIVIEVVLLFFILALAYAGISFAPWVPTWKKDFKRIFDFADLKQGDVFYDLGCGNGKIVLYANKKYQTKAIGVEVFWPLYFICKIRQLFNWDKNLYFKYANLFKIDISDADVVYFFGTPDSIKKKLKDKLEKELKPGTKVISYAFKVEGWEATDVSKPNKNDIMIYFYVVK